MNTHEVKADCERGGGSSYYEGPEIGDRLLQALVEAGLDPEALDVDDLAPLDEFHALGRGATLALADLAGVKPEQRVLDVGAGIGGPARVLASHYAAHVTALDATPRFCRAAELLTRGTGLADRVEIVCGDALDLPFAGESFDLAWTQAVSQNIPDKARFISELARVVKPGGQLALFEVLAGPGGSLDYPVPWADHAGQSWLFMPTELRQRLESAPLELVAWKEGQDVLESIAATVPRVKQTGSDRQLGLHILMPDFEARMEGLARNIAARKVTLAQAVARRGRT